MMKLIGSILLASVCAGVAIAEEQSKFSREGMRTWEYTRFIPTNVKRRVGFIYWIGGDDCVGATDIEVRVTKPPEHGALEVIAESAYPNYAKDSSRAKCNAKKVRGVAVYYKPAKDYKGTDEFEALAMYPSGFADEAKFTINVQ
jgi:hypothetical protein